MKKKKGPLIGLRAGQSTVEYIVLVTAVLGAVILFLNGPTSPFRDKLTKSMTTMTSHMETMANRIQNSTPSASPTDTSSTPKSTIDPLKNRCGDGQTLDPADNTCK